MLQIKKILFPTDFSACAERAFAHAAYLADRHEAELHVLHVTETYQKDDEVTYLMDEPVATDEEITEQLYIGAGRKGHEQDGLRVMQVQARGGSARIAILGYAEEHAIDLIVMGTHGRRGLDRLLMGSVAEAVVRRAACPVHTIRGDKPRVASSSPSTSPSTAKRPCAMRRSWLPPTTPTSISCMSSRRCSTRSPTASSR